MNSTNYKIFPLGTDALTIEFGNEISVNFHLKVVSLANYFAQNSFNGLIEIVPAYSSLTIFYDVGKVRKNFPNFPTAFAAIKDSVENALCNLPETIENTPRTIEIPVNFGAEYALDLHFVAAHKNLTTHEVIELFTAQIYRVFMLGFLPAFAYMGEVDAQIAAPRKLSPRLQVPKGSVGIAGRQTGIYPFDSPGGWQIIGRTDFKLFTPDDENPCALQAGDLVKFYAIDK